MEEEKRDEEDIVERLAREFLVDMEEKGVSQEKEKPSIPKGEDFISVPEKEPSPVYEEPSFKEEPLYGYEEPKEEPIQPTYQERPSTEKIEEILASIEEEERGITWPKEGPLIMEKEEEEEEIEEEPVPSEEELLVKKRPIKRKKQPSRLLKFIVIGSLLGGILGFSFYFGMRHFQPIIKFVNIGLINKILKPSCSITVSSSPEEAHVFLDDLLKGMTPLTIPKLPFGDHNLRVEKEGFKPFIKVVSISAKEPIDIVASLEPIAPEIKEEEPKIGTGTLVVRPNLEDAKIYVDGRISKMPIVLSPGIYSIKVQKEGFSTFARSIEIKGGEKIEIIARLSSLFGSLLVDSIPRGGYVFFDGSRIGKTPVIIPSLASWKPYNVQIKIEGFSLWSGKTFVEPNQRTKIIALMKKLDMEPKEETRYEPKDVRIVYERPYERESFIPEKPPLIKEAMPQELLELKRAIEEFKKMPPPSIPYPSFTQEYEPIRAYVPPSLPEKPKPKIATGPSACFITSIPPGAEIFLDGRPIGKTPIRSLVIEGGRHKLKAVLAEYKEEEKEVLVDGKTTNFFNFSLTKK